MPQNGHLIKICLFAQEMMIHESMNTLCVQLFQNFIPSLKSSVDPDQLASDEAS